MLHRRLVKDWHAQLEIHQRLTCLVGDWRVWSETNQRPTCIIQDPSETDIILIKICTKYKNKYISINLFEFLLNSAVMLVSNGSPQACQSLMVHVGLQWVYDLACWSLMGPWYVFDRSSMGLWSSMSVSNGSLIGLLIIIFQELNISRNLNKWKYFIIRLYWCNTYFQISKHSKQIIWSFTQIMIIINMCFRLDCWLFPNSGLLQNPNFLRKPRFAPKMWQWHEFVKFTKTQNLALLRIFPKMKQLPQFWL